MMWWNDDVSGWAWLAMSVSMLVFWGLVIWGVVSVVRLGDRASAASRREPEEILGERFARGEIDRDEFEARREVLRR